MGNFSHFLNTVNLIVAGFLIITLLIGLWAGRNIKTFKEYALGNKRFSSVSLSLTFFATWIGGQSIVGSVGDFYKIGILAFLPWLAGCVQLILIALLFSNSLSKFKNVYTSGDLMNIFYGPKIKILTGILVLLWVMFNVNIQLLMLGKVLEHFYNIDKYWGVIIGGTIIMVYSTIGGINSVTKTDIFQFIILIIVIPIIATSLLHEIGGYKSLFFKLPSEKLSIFNSKEFNYWVLCFVLFKCFSFHTLLYPSVLQRIFIASDPKKIRNQLFSLTVFDFVIGILFTLIGLSIFVLFPKINSETAIFHAVDSMYFSNIIKGIIISGFFAIIMSTADSDLNSCGIVFFNDVFKPVLKISEEKSLFFVKILTLIISIVTIFTTLFFVENSYYRLIPFYSKTILFPTIAFPFLAGILGIKSDNRSFILSGISGLIFTFIIINFFPKVKSVAIVIGILANAIVYMISHISQNNGIAWIIRKDEDELEDKLWVPNFEKIVRTIISFIPTPYKIYDYSRTQVMRYGTNNILFGVYCCINFTLPYFLWDHPDPKKYQLMINLRIIGGIMAALIIIKNAWKDFLKPFFPLFWHITLIYCLPFITTIMFLLTNGSISWLMNIGVSIFFLVILVAGEVFLILAPIGVILALTFYSLYIGPINLSALGFDINYHLIYQVTFSTIIALLFAYRKRFFYAMKGNQGLNLGLTMGHELKNTGSNILPYSEINDMYIKTAKETKLNDIEGYFLDKKNYKYIEENNNYSTYANPMLLNFVLLPDYHMMLC